MRRHALARLEYRKHRGFEPRYVLHNPPGLRTELDVRLRPDPVGDQRKDLPAGIRDNGRRIRGDFLHVWQFIGLRSRTRSSSLANQPPLAFDARHPGKVGIVVDAGIAELRGPQVEPLDEGDDRHEKAGRMCPAAPSARCLRWPDAAGSGPGRQHCCAGLVCHHRPAKRYFFLDAFFFGALRPAVFFFFLLFLAAAGLDGVRFSLRLPF